MVLIPTITQQDRLAESVDSGAQLKCFTATFESSGDAGSGRAEFRIDYVAPARVRVDRVERMGSNGEHTLVTTWCVEGVIATAGNAPGQEHHGRAHSTLLFAQLEPLELALRSAFPNSAPRATASSAVSMDWAFDKTAHKVNFAVEAPLGDGFRSPLGWLRTLQQKQAEAREKGDLLRLETDGHFRVTLSKKNGSLEELVSTDSGAKLRLVLRTLAVNEPVAESRFEPPLSKPGAREVSADLARAVTRQGELSLRQRIYVAIAAEPQGTAWNAGARTKIRSVMEPFHARLVPITIASWLENNRKRLKDVAKHLDSLGKSGKPAAEVEATRQRERRLLSRQLDERESGIHARLTLSPDATSEPRDLELLALEKEVLADIFRTLVREPSFAGFDQATAP